MLTHVKKKYVDAEYYRIQTQIHRGIPHVNRDKITLVMKCRSIVLGSNMKMGQNYDPRLKEIFGCRILQNFNTNS